MTVWECPRWALQLPWALSWFPPGGDHSLCVCLGPWGGGPQCVCSAETCQCPLALQPACPGVGGARAPPPATETPAWLPLSPWVSAGGNTASHAPQPGRVQTAVSCALVSVLQHYRVLGWFQSKVLFTLLTSMRTYYPLSFSAAWTERQSSGNTATVHTFQNPTQGLVREWPCFTRLPFRSPGLLENKLFLF